jgi:uncharacterized membrane protein
VSKAFWQNKSTKLLLAVGTVLGIGYPFAVYFSRGSISARSFVLIALALLILRLVTLQSGAARLWRLPLLAMVGMLIVTAALDADFAEKAYPTLMSAAAASAFGWSLRFGPSLVERFARIRSNDLTPAAILYCRKVTMIWTAWLIINALISGTLAIWGNLAVWAMWTGLISYLVMAVLFLSEVAVRHLVPAYRSRQ